MARTTQQIYAAIIQEKESFSSLDGLTPNPETAAGLLAALTSSSKVAIWRLWAWVVAYAHHLLEVQYDVHVAEVTALANAQKYGSLAWYARIAREFQLGYTLQVIDDFPGYPVVDEAAQIVTHSSAQDTGLSVIVKVAKTILDAPGPLTAAELSAFTAYMQQRKVEGTTVECVSLAADALRVVLEVQYNPILVPATVQADVEAAISAYAENLDFDARFKRLALEDALQAVSGVKGITITTLQGVSGGVVETFTQEYTAKAGYMTYDGANSTITLTPYI